MAKNKGDRGSQTPASEPILPKPLVWAIFLLWTLFILKADPQTNLFFLLLSRKPELFHGLIPALSPLLPEALFRHLTRFVLLAILALAAWGTGRLALRRLKLAWDNAFEEAAFALGAGLGILAYAALALGLLGLLYRQAACALVLICAAAGFWDAWKNPLSSSGQAVPGIVPKPLKFLFAAVAAEVVLIQLPHLLAPETFYDALVYHLNLPNLYLQNHRIVPTPSNLYSGIPFTAQMLFTLALALDGPVLARLLHCGAGLVSALAFMGLARRWRRPEAGWLAALFFLATPVVLYESYNTSTGLEWTLFQLLAFYALILALEAPEESRDRLWLLCGAFAGLSMAVKYPAWVLPLPLVLACARAPGRRIKAAALILVAAFLVLSPWLAKNIAFHKNPVFPYLQERFDPQAAKDIDWKGLNADADARDLRRTFTTWQGFKEYASHPWTFSTRVLLWESDYVGPLFLALFPLLFLFRRRHLPSAVWAWLCLGAWLPLSLMTSKARFFVPDLAPLAFLLAYAVLKIPWAGLRACALLLSAFLVAVHAALAGAMVTGSHKWAVVSGRQTEEDYLSREHPSYETPPYAGIRELNRAAPKDAKVLIVGDPRGLYLERDYESSSVFNTEVFFRLLEDCRGPEEFRARMKELGFTHVLVNAGYLFHRKKSFLFTENMMRNYAAYWNKRTLKTYEDLVNGDHWVIVYRILEDEEALKPHPVHDFLNTIFSIKPVPTNKETP